MHEKNGNAELSERMKRELIIERWLRNNYKSTKSRKDMVKCDEFDAKLNDYLKGQNSEPASRVTIGCLIKKVFGELVNVAIRETDDDDDDDGHQTKDHRVQYYAKLKVKK